MYVHVYMYIQMYMICVYIYIYREREIHIYIYIYIYTHICDCAQYDVILCHIISCNMSLYVFRIPILRCAAVKCLRGNWVHATDRG